MGDRSKVREVRRSVVFVVDAGQSQPNACDPLFKRLRAARSALYLERIRLAMKAGNTRPSRAGGPDARGHQTIASAVISLANDPNTVLTFARSTGATDFTRQMAAVAFASVARDDVENARLMIPQLAQAPAAIDDQPRSCARYRVATDGNRCHRRTGALA